MTSLSKLVLAVAVIAAFSIVTYKLVNTQTLPFNGAQLNSPTSNNNNGSEPAPDAQAQNNTQVDNPLAIKNDAEWPEIVDKDDAKVAADSRPTFSTSGNSASTYPPLSGYDVGVEPFTEESVSALIKRLQNDPTLVQEIMDEFRVETDPKRRDRLKLLLGKVANPELVPLAQEMLYSGTNDSQLAALDLLRRVQQENPAARTLALDVLTSSSENDVLVAAINVFSIPVPISADENQAILNQMLSLVEHDAPMVRQRSISTLSNWGGGSENIMPVLLTGLTDSDMGVRRTAAYALVGTSGNNEEAKLALLAAAENVDEHRGVRRAAVLALQRMELDPQTAERAEAAKLSMRKVVQQ